MTEPRQPHSLPNSKSKVLMPSSWGRRIVVALAVTGIIGTALVITLTVLAARFVGDAVDYLQSVDMTALQTKLSEADIKLGQHQREIIEPLLNTLKNEDLSLPQREEIGRTIFENLDPEQRNQLEILKNTETTGTGVLGQLLTSALRKMEELGVPLGMLSTYIQANGEKNPAPQ